MQKVIAYVESTIIREVEIEVEENCEDMLDQVHSYLLGNYDWTTQDIVDEDLQVYRVTDAQSGTEVWHESDLYKGQ